jgi:ribose 5-phosphate isomerase A
MRKEHFTDDVLTVLAERALSYVRKDTVVGLGSGRASTAFVRMLGARVAAGLVVRGVPTSDDTARLARELGIPLVGLDGEDLDVTVDGADEVDPRLDLIKGYGGALVRERIVAVASRRQIILVDESKLVPRLGSRGRLPVEVVPFGRAPCRRRLEALGLKPVLRMQGEQPFITDNCNEILDCAVGPIDDPAALERAIRAIPGVLDSGLFLGIADTVLVADGKGVRELKREGRP